MTEQNKSMFVIDGSADVDPSSILSESPGDIGSTLAQARNTSGLGLDQLSRELRIRREYLEAFERNRIEDLPSLPYATGFLRTYATALGLDPEPLVDQFKREMGHPHERTQLEFPTPMREGRLPGFTLALISLVLVALVYGGWRMVGDDGISGPDPVAVTGPETQAEEGAAARTETPAEEGAAARTETPAEPAEPRATAGEAPLAGDSRTPAGDDAGGDGPRATDTEETPAQQQAEAEPGGGAPGGASGPETEARADTGQPGAAATAPPADTPEQGIVLRATADSWLRIRNAQGRTIVARLMRAGESFQVPERSGLTMTLGNPGGVEVSVDGRKLEPLGASGVPIRGVSLDREALERRP